MCKGYVKIPRRLFETRWWNQKRVFSESDAIIDLYSRADKKNLVSVTVRSLADRWYWEQTRVLRFIQRLTKEGYIETTKSLSGTTIKILDFGVNATQDATPEIEKCNTSTPVNTGIDEVRCNTIDINTATPTATPSSSKRFVKPTIQEISDYCREKGYPIDAESFWNFYESKGWVVGKSPMKNWKAACATWNKKRTPGDPTRLNDNSTGKFKQFSW